jgi:hypothetical protein
MKRIVIGSIVCLLVIPAKSWVCPGAHYNQKPFNPRKTRQG